MVYPDKYVRQAGDVPDVEHYALFTTTSTYIPGDERSRTNPGHGYPASTEHSIRYAAFLTLEKLQAYLADKYNSDDVKYGRVVHVKPLKLTTEVKVNVG